MPGQEIGFGEARKAVMDIVAAEDSALAAAEYCKAHDDPSHLKVAEYGLLVPVVREGMTAYLEEPSEAQDFRTISELTETIGNAVGAVTVEAFNRNPHQEVISILAKRRSELVGYGNMIYPVPDNILAASGFAASAMYGIALSNALVIDAQAPDTTTGSRDRFIDAVKRSHQPALARTVMHILWNASLSEEFVYHATSFLEHKPRPNHDGIAYDPEHDRAVVSTPLRLWTVSNGMYWQPPESAITSLEHISTDDVRIGCPFSFEPELLKSYYEHMVDVIEAADCWPHMISDPATTQQISPLETQARFRV